MLDLVWLLLSFFFFWKVTLCLHIKGKTDMPLLGLFMRCYLLREHLDGTVSVWWEKVFSSCLLILSFRCTREWNTQCVISTEAESAFFSPSPFFLRCHILKKNKTEKEQIYSQGAWRSMNYLFSEILYYLCMKESPIIKSECFFFCMSITGRSEWTGC